MELKGEPLNSLNCLLCLKSLQTRKPLKWKHDEFVEGIASECCSTVNDQLSVIFLLRKLLEIPVVVCGELLESYGNPYYWISCCDSCSVIVDKGRHTFNQIVLLQKQLVKVQDTLKTSICNSGELLSNCDNAAKGPTWTLRSYIKNDINDVKLDLKILSNSPQGYNLEMPTEENIMDVKPSFDTVPQVKGRLNSTENNYKSKKELNFHVEDITEDLNIPSGSTCGAIILNTVTGVGVRKPEKSKQKKKIIPSWCDVCEKEFPSLKDLRRHRQRTHTEKTFPCKICKKVFIRRDRLQIHLRVHTGEKPFVCDICGKRFSQSGTLKGHLRVHTGEKPFVCDICGEGFSQSGTLKGHLRVHSGEKPFVCDTCGKGFSESCDLKRHFRTHTGEKPFACDICGKVFAESGTRQKHLRVHTGEKPFVCDTCGKRFSKSGDLKRHFRAHTGEKPYECKICGKEFARSDTLQEHLHTHTENKPYQCDICGKGISQSYDLKRHMLTHSGEKPFKCDICGKGFLRSSLLKVHICNPTGKRHFS